MTRLENTLSARTRAYLPVCLLAINPELLMWLSICAAVGNGGLFDGMVWLENRFCVSECLKLDC